MFYPSEEGDKWQEKQVEGLRNIRAFVSVRDVDNTMSSSSPGPVQLDALHVARRGHGGGPGLVQQQGHLSKILWAAQPSQLLRVTGSCIQLTDSDITARENIIITIIIVIIIIISSFSLRT